MVNEIGMDRLDAVTFDLEGEDQDPFSADDYYLDATESHATTEWSRFSPPVESQSRTESRRRLRREDRLRVGNGTAIISASRDCANVEPAGLAEPFDAKVDVVDVDELGLKGKRSADILVGDLGEVRVSAMAGNCR